MTIDNEMNKLTEMETDVIGEVMNISMGAAATAMSAILDKKVSITTPRIQQTLIDEFEFSYLEPVVGVLIKYIEGVDGDNILLLKEADLKQILGHLLSMAPEEIVELDEISLSAICEIMNQMMGSAASALASFLGQVVNISPPEIMDTTENVKEMFTIKGDTLVSIKFNLSIDGLIDSEFISAMDPSLAKEIVEKSYGVNDLHTGSAPQEPSAAAAEQAAPAATAAPAAQAVPTAAAAAPSPAAAAVEIPVAQAFAPVQETPVAAAVTQAAAAYTQAAGQAYQAAVEMRPVMVEQAPKQQVQATPYTYRPLGLEKTIADLGIDDNNLELIMSVPIQITVELGKTKKKIKDIAELAVGNIVELSRQAGDQVDVVANGRLIAKGDVVVVDDNYSVRITEIIKAKDSLAEVK
ncbi:MAG TPA: flagellar motor switch phosphatase FliY [Bacillota bacterium]|nr:flagellar motor switch phosphatase FliY [Bacillota bacterium]